MTVHDAAVARIVTELDRLTPEGRLGVAVSGGPDSLALLLLAVAARPGQVEAVTVDHRLRADSASEAAMVAKVCGKLGASHAILPVDVAPGASVQAQARLARYAALERWASERGLAAVATAHHADDQAETLLMRVARGAGLGGLAGVRASRPLGDAMLVRPLLGWRKRELVEIVADAGLVAVDDPANRDRRHDRTRVREWLTGNHGLDPAAVASSAAHLAEAEDALRFMAGRLFAERAEENAGGVVLRAHDLPRELQRRLLLLAIERLGDAAPRGADAERALASLSRGATCTLGSLKLEGGTAWRLSPAPPRKLSSRRAGP